jgi:hypothetical protein
MALVAERTGMLEPLREWIKAGNPAWVSLYPVYRPPASCPWL